MPAGESNSNESGEGGQPLFPELLDLGFWEEAFETGAPFYDAYVQHFGPAVVQELTRVINFHREAIYYAKDGAVGPIICRLIFIAVKCPEEEFVETLAFFLSQQKNTVRMKVYFSKLSLDLLNELIHALDCLAESLKGMGDDDLSDQYLSFQHVLKHLVTPEQPTTGNSD